MSKTHGYESRPQKIKIKTSESYKNGIDNSKSCHSGKTSKITRFSCPFKLSREYLTIRGNYLQDAELFFVLSDHSLVSPYLIQKTLCTTLKNLNLNPKLYNSHSFRIGWTGDLLRLGYSIEEIKIAGRWKSNVIYKYVRSFKW